MRRLRIGDRVLRVRDEGDSKKLPVVLVHGAGASSVVWMDVVRRLHSRRRVIAPDLPGHGQSDRWHPAAETSIEMYRDAIGTICAHLKVDKVILAGHSMGGQVALACAAAWPERVGGLVMVASGAQIHVAPRVYEVIDKDFSHFGEWLQKVSWSPATPREIVERWAGVMCTADQEITRADFAAVGRFDGLQAARQVRAPSLVLGGGDDLLTPPAVSRALAEALPGAQLTLVPNAGHMLMLEQADTFAKQLDGFLATLP